MSPILDDILEVARKSPRAALATLVATKGTAPRKEGTKMLVLEDMRITGAVTIGGCVDAQVIATSTQVIRTGVPQDLRLDLGEEDTLEIGLTCAGALHIWVEPVSLSPAITTQITHLLNSGTPFACLTVIRSSLDAIQPSAKALLSAAGELCGSLGEVRLNGAVSQVARELLARGVSRTVQLDQALTLVESIDVAAVEVFIDIVGSHPNLYILGAGQVAMPMAKLAAAEATLPVNSARLRHQLISENPSYR